MERKEFSIARFLSSKSRFDNIVLLEGFIVGILAGVVAVIYRLMLSYGEKIAYFVVDYIKNNTFHLCIWIICILMIGFIISKLLYCFSYFSLEILSIFSVYIFTLTLIFLIISNNFLPA